MLLTRSHLVGLGSAIVAIGLVLTSNGTRGDLANSCTLEV